jgi:uncharacterized protein YrrD
VQCVDGPNGKVECIIVDPTTQQITHIVVREGGLLGEAVMVPMELVTESSPSTLHIRLTAKQLQGMQVYVEDNYALKTYEPAVIGGYGMYPMGGVIYWPYSRADEKDYIHFDSTIPKGQLALHRSDAVEATDGAIGNIDEFLVDPRNDAITHLVLREGHLWGKKHVTIPVSQVASMADGVVHLKLDKQQIEALPSLHVGLFE